MIGESLMPQRLDAGASPTFAGLTISSPINTNNTYPFTINSMIKSAVGSSQNPLGFYIGTTLTSIIKSDNVGNLSLISTSTGEISFFNETTRLATILSTGAIGIGTATPERNLHISNTAGEAWLKLTSASNGIAGIEMSGVGSMWKIERHHTDDSLRIMKLNVGYFLNILSDGKVGIGTHLPTSTLEVRGLIDYANNAAAAADGLTAGAFYHITGTDYVGIVH